MTKHKTPKAPKCQSAEPKDRPLPAAPAEAPPGDSFVKWCNWWSQFPDRAALSRAKPAALLKMMLFWNSLPLFWTPPSSGAGRASWCVYGARAAEALVLAAAARPPLDGLKIEAAHKIFRQYIDSAKYYKKAAEDEAHKNKEGYVLFHYSDTLLEVLADHGPSEPECETFRQGLDELKRLSLRLESEAAEAGGQPAGGLGKRRTRRPPFERKPRPLTERQTEVINIVGECKGSLADAARRLGIDRKSLKESYDAGNRKLASAGVPIPSSRPKPKTERLPKDPRGQVNVAQDRRR